MNPGLFAKNEKEVQNLIQNIRIYIPDIVMEFVIGKYGKDDEKRKRRKKWKELNCPFRKASEN